MFGDAMSVKGNNYVSFKAGRMSMKGKTVTSIDEKGLIFMCAKDGDGLLHFCWKSRKTNTVDEELIIMASEPTEFRKLKQVKDGRVYVLDFKSSNRKLFYWMQEPDETKDKLNACKVNHLLKNTPVPGQDPFSNMKVDEDDNDDDDEKKDNTDDKTEEKDKTEQPKEDSDKMDVEEKSEAEPTPKDNDVNESAKQARFVQNLMAGMNQLGNKGFAGGSSFQSPLTLTKIFNHQNCSEAFSEELVKALSEHLPEKVSQTKGGILQMMKTPQFVQALQTLDSALNGGQLFPGALGITGDTEGKIGVEGLLNAIINENKNK